MTFKPDQPLTRRTLLRGAAGVGAVAAFGPVLQACGGDDASEGPRGSGELIIGSYLDPGFDPVKTNLIPKFERDTGIKVKYLEDEYGTYFEKAFQDGTQQAGQYDVYVMDDPWVPQYAAAGALLDLTAEGIELDDADGVKAWVDASYWPPRSGPRVKGFEDDEPKLVAVPFTGSCQLYGYRSDLLTSKPESWDQAVAMGAANQRREDKLYGAVFRGASGIPAFATFYTLLLSYGGDMVDDDWNVTFNDDRGQQALRLLVDQLRPLAPPGVAEFDNDQLSATLLGGDALMGLAFTGTAFAANDPKKSQVVDKLTFTNVPAGTESRSQSGLAPIGIPVSAPNKDNALRFIQYMLDEPQQVELARLGIAPYRLSALTDRKAVEKWPTYRAIVEQDAAGLTLLPRSPDVIQLAEILGDGVGKAIASGTVGDELNVAAGEATAMLKKNGYYGS